MKKEKTIQMNKINMKNKILILIIIALPALLILVLEWLCVFKPWIITKLIPTTWLIESSAFFSSMNISIFSIVAGIACFGIVLFLLMAISVAIYVLFTVPLKERSINMSVIFIMVFSLALSIVNVYYLNKNLLRVLPLKKYPVIARQLQTDLKNNPVLTEDKTIDIEKGNWTGNDDILSASYYVKFNKTNTIGYYDRRLNIYARIVVKNCAIVQVYAYIPQYIQKNYSSDEYSVILGKIISNATEKHRAYIDPQKIIYEKNISSYSKILT